MASEVIQNFKRPPLLGGAMIIAGTTVGAGMFSIPIVTSGVWFTGSIILLVYTWACMFFSGLMILEANMNYPSGASFHTMVKDLLGARWNLLNSISITFVLYILTYAYISAGGSIITHNLNQFIPINHPVAGLLFSLLIAFVVWLSTKAVDRLSTILIGGMIITFIMSVSGMFNSVSSTILFNKNSLDTDYLPYAFIALPYLLTSFGFHGNVPGLVKYYHKESKAVVRSLLYGTLIALVIYILWQYAVQGNISRTAFKQIITEGGNVDSLLKQMNHSINNNIVKQCLNLFSYMALASSFLGVTLGLFDFIADFFKFKDNNQGRLKSALITFIPPTLFALYYPDGFIHAIGFAGLAATIWAVIVPAMMAKASRKKFPQAVYHAPGGDLLIYFVILFGLINAVIHILALLDILPVYK
ncbi:tryptophan permease [Arsenophonus apicola]|uniref:Aromatic amino acid permease n=1 Tax=Arsenophonus apicola TaxID=2879119 RepID=A0ABY8P528_9GAMM|nr:tryptophan permease [Arsenophonus apicola]WGO84588.1 tryptophan permease [Arsenophonus apicola]